MRQNTKESESTREIHVHEEEAKLHERNIRENPEEKKTRKCKSKAEEVKLHKSSVDEKPSTPNREYEELKAAVREFFEETSGKEELEAIIKGIQRVVGFNVNIEQI
eukprot:TRINITY_DN15633_c0_g3_i3.p1 TRINITY_DN15633_c0_g3~~TRINITY_DN15633_c0_g3_i3.p1  ORF type:complete len:106 (-),score=24.30 TRINITY_DN15633_c0_g3_i3:213-530(-)